MSEDLWKQKEKEIIDLKSKVERDQIELAGQVLKVTKDDAGVSFLQTNTRHEN